MTRHPAWRGGAVLALLALFPMSVVRGQSESEPEPAFNIQSEAQGNVASGNESEVDEAAPVVAPVLTTPDTPSDPVADLTNAKAQSGAARAKAERLASAVAGASTEGERARLAMAALSARINGAEADMAAGEARVAMIERLRARQRAKLAERQSGIVRLMGAIQTMSRRPPSMALVQPGSISDVAHVRALLAAAMPEMLRRTAGLRAEVARGRQLRADADAALVSLRQSQLTLIDKRNELATMEASLSGGNPALETSRALALGERARDVVELMNTLDDQDEIRAALVGLPGPIARPDGEGQGDLLGSLNSSSQRKRRLPAYQLPVNGPLVTGLGEVSPAGVPERGITLYATVNAKVMAPNRGRVAYAGPFRGYGHIVIIDHGKRWFTLITGMASLTVRQGDDVLRGAVVGALGNGNRNVTVELRRSGLPVDLTPLLRRG